jgi:hypothetical protein
MLPLVPDYQKMPTMLLDHNALFTCTVLQSRLRGCSCPNFDLLRLPCNIQVQSQPTVVQHHGCQCRRPPKGATRPRFGFFYTSPLSSTSKNCTSISSRSRLKLCALRIATFRESVAASQQGLRALLGMVGFEQILTVRAATRLFSGLLSGSNHIQQRRDARRLCVLSVRYSDFSQFIASLELGFTMGWISHYGKRQDDFARPAPVLIKFHHVIAVMFFITLLAGCIACFPLTLAFVPKPQLTEYMPKGVHCATCEEIWQHNPDLFNREDMMCYGPSTYVRNQACKVPLHEVDRSRNFRPKKRRKSCIKGKRGVGPLRKGTTSGCVLSR